MFNRYAKTTRGIRTARERETCRHTKLYKARGLGEMTWNKDIAANGKSPVELEEDFM